MPKRSIASVIAGQQIVTGAPNMTVQEAAMRMTDAKVGAILVVEAERLVGIFTERDALNRVLAENRPARTVRLAEVMTRDPATISVDRPLGHALHLMLEGGFRHVPVVDAGRPVGMVSARDALGSELMDFEGEVARREEINQIL
jgi:CBS domain-containing protein